MQRPWTQPHPKAKFCVLLTAFLDTRVPLHHLYEWNLVEHPAIALVVTDLATWAA